MQTFRSLLRALHKGPKPSKSQPPVPCQLERLPTEVQLQILSYLEYGQLGAARSLNRHFKHLVELKANHSFFAEQLIEAFQTRLRHSVYNFTRTGPYSAVQAMFKKRFNQFLMRRGLWLQEEFLTADLKDFLMIISPLLRSHAYSMDDMEISVVLLCMQMHLRTHLQAFKAKEIRLFTDARKVVEDSYGNSHAKAFLRRLLFKWECTRAKATPHTPLTRVIRHEGNDDLLRPLTKVTRLHSTDEQLKDRQKGLCSVTELCDTFGIPEIPEEICAYNVRSEEAYGKVKALFEQSDSPPQPRYLLTRIEKMRVLSDMFIC